MSIFFCNLMMPSLMLNYCIGCYCVLLIGSTLIIVYNLTYLGCMDILYNLVLFYYALGCLMINSGCLI